MTASALNALLKNVPDVTVYIPFAGWTDITPFLTAVGVFFALSGIFWLLRKIVLVRLQAFSKKTATDIDDTIIDAVASIRAWVYVLIAAFISLQLFNLPETLDSIITGIVLFAVVWQAIEIALCFISYATTHYLEKDEDGDGVPDPNTATASDMVKLMARIVLWALGGLFVLSNLGIEVTSLIAGLGIGGIAVAFALQGILSDLFSSFSLYFDKPFRVGDFIIVGESMGTVERIGVKTTRIRTLQGEELAISNGELTSARIQNFKRMNDRRIQFSIGITYETTPDLVKSVPGMVREIISDTQKTRFDRAHFASYGDSALIFEIVYHVLSSDYNEYMDVQQEINEKIMDAFAQKGIEFAYPTQTLYVKK